MITRLSISGYRSLRDIGLELEKLNVITGANGSGKSSLYRALRLLADIAQGRAIASLAKEGGLESALWAGIEKFSREMKHGREPIQGTVRKKPMSLKLGFSGEDYGYAIDLGIPIKQEETRFARDPEIKLETLWTGETLSRSNVFAERSGPSVRIRDEKGVWQQKITDLSAFDSMLTHCGGPREAVELFVIRERLKAWRFYDCFRTDTEALARRPQIGTRTPVLASDGSDLAAAIATIQEIGADDELDEAVADAFPGSSISARVTDGYFEVEMRQRGLQRALKCADLSEGTLRYLLLLAALLSPRPPDLMILNEPETSLHPDLLPPLARLIVRASERSQIIIVSHSQALVTALKEAGSKEIILAKELGGTIVLRALRPAWNWRSR